MLCKFWDVMMVFFFHVKWNIDDKLVYLSLKFQLQLF